MHRTIGFVALLTTLAVSVPAFAQDKPILAVMEIEDKTGKFKRSDLEAAMEFLSTLLITSGQYSVVEKGRQEAKKKQVVKHLKRETHDACYDDKCRIELGRALAADTLLTCSIIGMGESCTLTCRMVPLEKEVADKAGATDINCSANALPGAVKSVAGQLADGLPHRADNSRPTVEAGARSDPNSNLTWQVAPIGGEMSWSAAKLHCARLDRDGHSDWRLPTIGELRSLIRGCSNTEVGGTCRIRKGRCLDWWCRDDSCDGCSEQDGPADGCYWLAEMQGACRSYWSSTPVEDHADAAWTVRFNTGSVHYGYVHADGSVRCVHDAP